jgi:ribosome-binding factor A
MMKRQRPFKRADKIAEAIHEVVSGLLIKGIKDPRVGFVTVTAVEVTDDLHLARIYYSMMGDENARRECAAGLNSAQGFFRREVGKNLQLRYIPDILFVFDESIERGSRIDALLNEIQKAEEPHD